jgi:hypothetical protein
MPAIPLLSLAVSGRVLKTWVVFQLNIGIDEIYFTPPVAPPVEPPVPQGEMASSPSESTEETSSSSGSESGDSA